VSGLSQGGEGGHLDCGLGALWVVATVSLTCDPHGCCTLNGVLAARGPKCGRVLTVWRRGEGAKRGVRRGDGQRRGGGGGGRWEEGCRLTAAWVRHQNGCNLISSFVSCTIPVRCLIFVRILALCPFPSFSKLHYAGLYSGFPCISVQFA
jgi:hypothetical protein